MIHEMALQAIRVLIAESNPITRHKVKSSLYTEGYRTFEEVTDGSRLEDAIVMGDPDLIIADAGMEGVDVCTLGYRLRHHELTVNPFIPFIVMGKMVDKSMVKKVINSGADHFLVKPWKEGELEDRVTMLIHSRKAFVVTTEYIGPDRRTKQRKAEGEVVPLLHVPNALHAKVVENMPAEKFQQSVDDMADTVNEHKVGRHAQQILWLANKILPVYSGSGADQMLPNYLDRMIYVTEDMSRRCEGTHQSKYMESLNELYVVAQNLRARYNTPEPEDVANLEDLTRKIGSSFVTHI